MKNPQNYQQKISWSMLAVWQYKKKWHKPKLWFFFSWGKRLPNLHNQSPCRPLMKHTLGPVFWEQLLWAVVTLRWPIPPPLKMANLDHWNAHILFNCTELLNKLLLPTLQEDITTEHMCAHKTAADHSVPYIPLCHLALVFIQEESDWTKTVPSTSPVSSHTLPPFMSPALCVVNSIISNFQMRELRIRVV